MSQVKDDFSVSDEDISATPSFSQASETGTGHSTPELAMDIEDDDTSVVPQGATAESFITPKFEKAEDQNKTDELGVLDLSVSGGRFTHPSPSKDTLSSKPQSSSNLRDTFHLPIGETKGAEPKMMTMISPLKQSLGALDLEFKSESKELSTSTEPNRRRLASSSSEESEEIQLQESPTKKIRIEGCSTSYDGQFKIPKVPPLRSKSKSPAKSASMLDKQQRSSSKSPEALQNVKLRRSPSPGAPHPVRSQRSPSPGASHHTQPQRLSSQSPGQPNPTPRQRSPSPRAPHPVRSQRSPSPGASHHTQPQQLSSQSPGTSQNVERPTEISNCLEYYHSYIEMLTKKPTGYRGPLPMPVVSFYRQSPQSPSNVPAAGDKSQENLGKEPASDSSSKAVAPAEISEPEDPHEGTSDDETDEKSQSEKARHKRDDTV